MKETAATKANPKRTTSRKTATEAISGTASNKRATAKAKRAKSPARAVQEADQVPLTNGTGKGKMKRKAGTRTAKPSEEPVASTSQEAKEAAAVEVQKVEEEEEEEQMETEATAAVAGTKKVPKRTAAKDEDEVPEKKARTAPVVSRRAETRKRQKDLLKVPPFPDVTGVLFVVGENDCGQLGLDPDIAGKKKPYQIEFPFRFVDVAAGGMHSVCLTDRGEVWTFGCNDEGALGRPTVKENSEYIPEKVDIPGVVVRITAGDSHSAALTEDGKVYVWGNFRGNDGCLGLIAPGVKSEKPVRIMSGSTAVSIASGDDHLVILTNDGKVYTCGCGELGQLGRVTERSSKGEGRKSLLSLLQPDRVPVRLAIGDIWSGGYSTFVKSQISGKIYAFGLNNYNQLGFEGGESAEKWFHPKQVDSLEPSLQWKQISIGQHHTLALDGTGKVYSVGNKNYGRLGLGEDCDFPTKPTLIPTLQDEECVTISAGNTSSFSVSSTGKAYSWGMGTGYQLGHGDEEDYYVPTPIKSLMESWHVIKVSGGGQHTLIVARKKEEET